MTRHVLSMKEAELIAVGCSLAANCQKCANYHFKRVFEEGATLKEVNRVIVIANEVMESSQEIMRNWAEALIPESKRNEPQSMVDFEEGFEDLVRVGAAVALSNPTNMRKYIDTVKSSQVEEKSFSNTLNIAKMVRDNSERFAREEVAEKWPDSFGPVSTVNQDNEFDAVKASEKASMAGMGGADDDSKCGGTPDERCSVSELCRIPEPSDNEGLSLEAKVEKRTREIRVLSAQVSELNLNLEQRVEEEVRKRQENEQLLIQQSKMAAMGEMIGMIAHQWRQPLSSIGAVMANLKVQFDLGMLNQDDFNKTVEEVNGQIQYMSTTITDFRSFLNPTKKQTTCLLTEVIDNTLRIIEKSLATSGVEVEKRYAFTHPMTTYPNELIQVVINILKNAQDIFREKEIENPVIRIKGFETSEHQIVEITDNGGGIPEAILDKIFDAYYTTKEDAKGTGLGLFMSKTIVEKHCGGLLTVTNSESGACFRIEVPNRNTPEGSCKNNFT